MSNANFPSVSPLDSFYTVSGLDTLKLKIFLVTENSLLETDSKQRVPKKRGKFNEKLFLNSKQFLVIKKGAYSWKNKHP